MALTSICFQANAQISRLDRPVKLPPVANKLRGIAHVGSKTVGDTLSIHVHAPASDTFTLAISDTSGVLQTLDVSGGRTPLPLLPIGKYSYTLTDTAGVVVSKGHFSVKPPHVHSSVRSVELGDTLKIHVRADSTETFTLVISDTSGVVQTLTVFGGKTLLPSLPLGHYSYNLVNTDGLVVDNGRFAVKAPRVSSHIHSVTLGDTLSIHVKAKTNESFVLVISDTSGVIQTLTITGGKTNLPALPLGKFAYTLTNSAGLEVSSGSFSVRTPKVHSSVRSVELGDTLSIYVKADSASVYTLTVSDASGTVVLSMSVSGGRTLLPMLAVGKYSYTLTDASGYVVDTGRFSVKPPHVHAHIHYNRFSETLSIKVAAAVTESFTLTVTDTSGAVVLTSTVTGGTTVLDTLPVGKYEFTLANEAGVQVEKGKFEVKTPLVHSSVYPNPSTVGEGSIILDAPASESFSLVIYGASSTPIYSGMVTGGTSLLPNTLAAGVYHYRVTNADGEVVSKGKIIIVL